jgi:quercetin dioxygenase-like cupin family protein
MPHSQVQSLTLADLQEREQFPGYRGRFIHSERMSLVYWNIAAGAVVPEHSHPHEQVVNALEGEFELVVAGITYRLRPGRVVVVPPDVRHSGRAVTTCRVLDVFSPVREDYR